MKKFFGIAMKILIGIICSVISFFWLIYAYAFVSPIWTGDPKSKDYEEDMILAPLGIFMAIIWIICLVVFIIKVKNRRNSAEQDENPPIEKE